MKPWDPKRMVSAVKVLMAHQDRGAFDPMWYQRQYRFPRAACLIHFAFFGMHRGCLPNPRFDIATYLSLNPDVNASGMNPILHYMLIGWREKRPLSVMERHRSLAGRVVIPEQAERSFDAAPDPNRLKITWVIPDFIAGNGGHMNIFRMASHLDREGHDVTLLVIHPSYHGSSSSAKKTINGAFLDFRGEVILAGGILPELRGDALIATDWSTCYAARAMSGFRRKFYFVQDHESEFYPTGAESLLAEQTYSMGFDCLSNGEWLHHLMQERYDCWSTLWHQSHDRDVYFATPDASRSRNRIAFYVRQVTPRRAVELGLIALEILAGRGVDFEVDFFGWDLGKAETTYRCHTHGVLDGKSLGDLYRSSAIGMVFSATNHSIINKEMMACGLPVLDLDVPSVKAVFPRDVIATAPPQPEAIADKLQELLGNGLERERLSRAGAEFAGRFTWEDSAKTVEKALKERILTHSGELA